MHLLWTFSEYVAQEISEGMWPAAPNSDAVANAKLRLRNSDGCRDVLGRLFRTRTRSVMGRLWDDHFRDLGYPPKFYMGQDAGFDSGSSS